MHCITVVFTIQARHAAAFRAAVVANAQQSLAQEPGCRTFDVCADAAGTRFFLYELYDDEAAFKHHLGSAHFKAFDAQVTPWVLDKSVQAWQRLDA
jgi:(4S)-4-hydroxy-5-phosphonooxypentane-2,3-dione isomerase